MTDRRYSNKTVENQIQVKLETKYRMIELHVDDLQLHVPIKTLQS
jgi:hypothetical protein